MPRRITAINLCIAVIQATLGLALAQTPSSVKPSVAKWTPRPLPDNEVNLLAMGDWGANTKEQKLVADALARYCDRVGTQFNGLVSVGELLGA